MTHSLPTMHLSLALALPFLLAPLAGCSSTTPSSSTLTEADVAAIRAVDAAWVELATAGKFAALVERCYTSDAVLLPPNEPAAKGRAAIEASLRNWPPMSGAFIHSDEVVGFGGLAYTTGTWGATLHPKGAAPVQDKGKFVVIWRKDNDGAWRMTRDSFSSDIPVARN